MQQIFKRIKRILEAEKNFSDNSTIINDSDDELKRIIEELNQKKSEDFEKDNSYKSRSEPSGDNFQDSNNSRNGSTNINDLKRAFSVLEIPESSTNEEIRSAYLKKIKEYHPDRVQNLGQEIKNLADKKTKEINQAYEFIQNHRNR